MPQYKVEYRESPEGALLKSGHITAPKVEDAEAEVKREFAAVQANLGARQYEIQDDAGVVVAFHHSSDEPMSIR
jgi:hypothetical protein